MGKVKKYLKRLKKKVTKTANKVSKALGLKAREKAMMESEAGSDGSNNSYQSRTTTRQAGEGSITFTEETR